MKPVIDIPMEPIVAGVAAYHIASAVDVGDRADGTYPNLIVAGSRYGAVARSRRRLRRRSA